MLFEGRCHLCGLDLSRPLLISFQGSITLIITLNVPAAACTALLLVLVHHLMLLLLEVLMLDIVDGHSLHHRVRMARVVILCLSMLMHHTWWYSRLLIVLRSEEMTVLWVLCRFELMIHSFVVRSSLLALFIEALLRVKKIMWMVWMIVRAHVPTV